MVGFGAQRQVNDMTEANREPIGRRKTPREIYREEVRKRSTGWENVDVGFVKARVRKQLRQNIKRIWTNRILILLAFILFIVFITWLIGLTSKL